MKSEVKKLMCLLATASLLAACGGGGGGGGSSSPASVDNGNNGGTEPPHVADMKTGVFYDGPVAGLRYKQGINEGVTTADGSFSYDANSSAPVEFYVGKVFLGQAQGSALVTPFDLYRPGVATNVQSGYNLTRFLLSLDQSSNDGIQLPEESSWAQGAIDFNASQGVFEANEDLADLIERYSSTGEMVDLATAQDHLAANEYAQQDIVKLNQQRVTLNAIQVNWNPDLREAGVLAEVKASNGEALYLETNSTGSGQTFKHWLSSIFYEDGKGHYLSIKLNVNGSPGIVNRNGTQYRYMNLNLFSLEDAVNVDLYKPTYKAYLFERQDYNARIPAGAISGARTADIGKAIQELTDGTLTDDGMQQLLEHSLAMVNNVMCAGSTGVCDQGSIMADYLSHTYDEPDLATVISFDHGALSENICMGIALTQTNELSCNGKNALHELNVYFANQSTGFKGPKLIPSYSWIPLYGIVQKIAEYGNWARVGFQSTLDTEYYQLDHEHVLVHTTTADRGYYYAYYHSPDDGVDQPSDRKEDLDAGLEEVKTMIFKYFHNTDRIFTKVPTKNIEDVFYVELTDSTRGPFYVDLNNHPYVPGDSVDRVLKQEDLAFYPEHDPRSEFYVVQRRTDKLDLFSPYLYSVFANFYNTSDHNFYPDIKLGYLFVIQSPGCGRCEIVFGT